MVPIRPAVSSVPPTPLIGCAHSQPHTRRSRPPSQALNIKRLLARVKDTARKAVLRARMREEEVDLALFEHIIF